MEFSGSGYFSEACVCYDSCGLLLLVSSLPPLIFFFFFPLHLLPKLLFRALHPLTSSYAPRISLFFIVYPLSPNIFTPSLQDYGNCQAMVNKYAIIMLNTVSCYLCSSDATNPHTSFQSSLYVYSAPLCLLRVLHVPCQGFSTDNVVLLQYTIITITIIFFFSPFDNQMCEFTNERCRNMNYYCF